ncbi:MAG: hypothetical protein HC894_08150 [Microcoleus sp. SM1_3_4]|nr:hypothetical protein [Microcoleus sp. SM1_3_4]
MRSRMRWLIAVLLALGIFFRFANIDKKIYGLDESYTSLRISSYTEAELVQDLSKTRIIGADYLKNISKLVPKEIFWVLFKDFQPKNPSIHPCIT